LNRAPIETIKWNLEQCRFSNHAEIRRGDAFSMLGAQPEKQFEFIYIAPPQFKEMWLGALLALDANPGWLTDTGWAIVQIAPKEYQEPKLNNLEELEQRKYGSTLLVFFGLKEN
jgi:16S rRNA G966 N2-methylase RsmD